MMDSDVMERPDLLNSISYYSIHPHSDKGDVWTETDMQVSKSRSLKLGAHYKQKIGIRSYYNI